MFSLYDLGAQTGTSLVAADDDGDAQAAISGRTNSTQPLLNQHLGLELEHESHTQVPHGRHVSVQPNLTLDQDGVPANQIDELAQVSAPEAIDRLAHKMSRQNLQLDKERPSDPVDAAAPGPQPWPGLEVDDGSQPAGRCVDMFDSGPLEVDQGVGYSLAESRRLRRQLGTQFHNNPTSASRIESLVADMISTGTQCNVRSAPLPAWPARPVPTAASESVNINTPKDDEPRSQVTVVAPPGILEVDPDYEGQPEIEDRAWADEFLNMRRVRNRGLAKRQKHLNGIVTYEGAQATAFRCETVVKSRIRMRKRRDGKSVTSSIAPSSLASSPVIPPSLPSPSGARMNEFP